MARPYSRERRVSSARAFASPPFSKAPPSAPSMTVSATLSVSTSMKC